MDHLHTSYIPENLFLTPLSWTFLIGEKNLEHVISVRNVDFHLTIAQCSHNPILHSLLLTIRKLVKHISKSGMLNLEDLKTIYEEHTRIYTSIITHDPSEAVASMTYHLESAHERYHLK